MASSVSVSVPIWLTLTRIELADAAVDAALQPLGVRDEEVVADELDRVADPVGQRLPAVPVLLVHAVLDREDRVAAGEVGPVAGHLVGRERAALVLEDVAAALEDLARGRVERDDEVLAGRVARGLDARDERLERRLVGLEVRREAALVADAAAEAAVVQVLLEVVEDLGAHAQRVAEARRADRHDHELLEVDGVVGVRAAVEDVHHRHGQDRARPRRRGSATAAGPPPRPRRARRRARRRGWRSRRGGSCSACRRGRSARGRGRTGRARRGRRSPRRSRR